MKPMALNISKMFKIAGDKKTSTFKHPSGHEIVIVHAALPASMRKEIEKLPLAKGGEVKLAAHEEGVNKQSASSGNGKSIAGNLAREGKLTEAKESHAHKLQQLRDMPKPKLAEGGDVLPKYMHPPKDPKMVAVPRLAMAEGGSAKPTGNPSSTPVQDSTPYDQTLSNGWNNIKKAFMAEGGMMEGQGPCRNPNCKSYGHVHPNCKCYGGYAKGGVVQSACDSKSYHHPSCQFYAEGGIDWNAPGADPINPPAQGVQNDVIAKDRKNDADEKIVYGEMTHKDVPEGTTKLKAGERVKMYADPQEPVAADDSAPVAEAAPVEQAPPAQQPAPPPPMDPAAAMANQNPMQGVDVPTVPEGRNNLNPNGTMNPSAVAENAQTAEDAQKNVAVAAGKAHANMQAGYLQQTAENQQKLQQNYQQIAGHVQDFDSWMGNNKVDPNHYVESTSTARKASTALGLFLGGLGQINGGNNPALDYLNRQIDRDIDAQKARVDQAKTVYGAYRDLYGDGVATYNATKASMLDVLAHQSDQVTAQLGTPLAQANNLKLKTAVALEKSKLLKEAAVSLPDLPGTVPGQQINRNSAPVRSGGAPSAPAKGSQSGASNEHLLTPEANNSFKTAQYKPEYKDDKDEVKSQLEGASLADKAVDSINKHFTRMYANIHSNEVQPTGPGFMNAAKTAAQQTLADLPGYIHKKGENLEGVPYIGSTISGLAKGATDTAQNRSYDVHRDAMLSSMTAALVHSGMSPTEAHDTAITFLPVEGDDLQAAREKMATAKEKIKQTTKTNALERHNLIQKQGKR